MQIGQAGGFQIAFFTYALLLLSVPMSRYLNQFIGATEQAAALLTKATPFAVMLLLWALIPALRRAVSRLLSEPIPRERRVEVTCVAVASTSLAFVYAGSLAFWFWVTGGPAGVEEHVRVNVDKELRSALSPTGIVTSLFLVSLIGPIVEEVIFRGFLYRAFEARWGWFAALILTSTLFGLYHPHFHAAFTTAVVLVCVLRRTGSLWSPIAVHVVVNLALWWPLTGQFVIPHGVTTSRLDAWHFHIACAVFALIALPSYVWLSRKQYRAARYLGQEPNAPLPQ